MGKQKEIYIFSYFGMFSKYIHDFECFYYLFLLGGWCLGVKKMWESKGMKVFFLFDLFDF